MQEKFTELSEIKKGRLLMANKFTKGFVQDKEGKKARTMILSCIIVHFNSV